METRNQLSKRHLRPSSAHTSTRGYAFAGTAGMGKMIQDGEAFVQVTYYCALIISQHNVFLMGYPERITVCRVM